MKNKTRTQLKKMKAAFKDAEFCSSRKALIFGAFVLGICAVVPVQSLGASAALKQDVLFIAIDDMNDWTTLFDKENPIQTPNLQRLAQRGCFFNKAYCTVPACNPSRTSILTGLQPDTTGVYENSIDWKSLLPDAVTLPQHFQQNGYAAIGGGKIFHHGKTGGDRVENPSFDSFFTLKLHANKPQKNYNGYIRKKDDKHLASPSWDWGEHDVVKQTDEYTVEYINNIMASHPRDEPLFLAAGIFRPHLPFWAPSSTFDRYPLETLQIPPRPEGDLDDVPARGIEMAKTERFIWENTIVQPPDSPRSLKKMIQSYQAAADYSDEMVGRLLDQLEATGRADNTIIVLWSDHGYHLGDKTACVKFTLWEKSDHVPFIIVAPGITTPGSVCERPVSLIDIYPTLAELAGLPEKPELDGQSLVPLLKNTKLEWARPALTTQIKGNHAIRTQTHRYIRYEDGTEELYTDADYWNHTNLVNNPEEKAVLTKHRKLMDQMLVEFE
ncbi:sulfatase [Pontiella sulfatireligans]|uniref:Choline-sulfatase n=1 Tax=Pontiella sulfatireligans TaxID=2750658 RepID=A0A6C2UQX1_9BACT|nr:sulfatase [Pontiella sulfatireligans]SPS74532.1 sulfatase S1_7 [Kiritimatiellales bacterium]VGO22700.1 Choline-sulfatase [Pontiella sulfatireligans]